MEATQCELCDRPARIQCESDQASLCWDCDSKVHGANFLVARHSRCLLCRSCQSPTPWRAEGARLGPTMSVCDRCSVTSSVEKSSGGRCGIGGEEVRKGGCRDEEDDLEGADEEEEEDEEDYDDDDDLREDDDGENQVVPWSLTPPPVASSSSSEEGNEEVESGRTQFGGRFLKRMRENDDLAVTQDDLACSSTSPAYLASAPSPSPALVEDEATSVATGFRPSKDCKRLAPLLGHSPSLPDAGTAAPAALGPRLLQPPSKRWSHEPAPVLFQRQSEARTLKVKAQDTANHRCVRARCEEEERRLQNGLPCCIYQGKEQVEGGGRRKYACLIARGLVKSVLCVGVGSIEVANMLVS